MLTLQTDVAIIGGGIAGLWTKRYLESFGYRVLLLESNAIGSGQTLSSQGIVHGGVKYALKGKLTASHDEVSLMPKVWKEYLSGQGRFSLEGTEILSDTHWLWSPGGFWSNFSLFFSKTLRSRVTVLEKEQYPEIFRVPQFRGKVFALDEIILNVESLLASLSSAEPNTFLKIEDPDAIEFMYDDYDECNALHTVLEGGEPLRIEAQFYIVTAGEGALPLLPRIRSAPQMQKRPLQMVMLKWERQLPLYAHCMDGGANPRVTITTHAAKDGKTVWYIGGQLAEEGALRSREEQLMLAQAEIRALFPWLNYSKALWETLPIMRAECAQPNNKRPDGVTISQHKNVFVAWPTKLTLSPVLAQHILDAIHGAKERFESDVKWDEALLEKLPKPGIALPPWDRMF